MDQAFFLGIASLLLFLSVVGVIAYLVFMFDVALGRRDFATTNAGVKQVSKILAEFQKQNGSFCDLGSSRGGFVIRLLLQNPNLKATGIDFGKFRIMCSIFSSWALARRADFFKLNIFDYNLNDADVVYIYLGQPIISKLEKKLLKELKKGSIVILNTQYFPNWKPVKVFITHPKNPKFEKMSVYVKS